MPKKLLHLFILACFSVMVNGANAATYTFDSGTSGFTTFGNASPYSGSVQLTAPEPGQVGSIFLNKTLNSSRFTASFDFRNTEPLYSVYGGDGITFAWVTTQGIGGGGGELGFTGLDGYMVEFDTYWNAGYDPPDTLYGPYGDDTDHIAVATSVASPLAYSNTPEMEESGWHHVDIAFNNGQIQVQMDGVEYINHVIAGYSGSEAYFGFTGSTGASSSRQLVDNFEINAVPLPATFPLLGAGLLALVGLRKKFKK